MGDLLANLNGFFKKDFNHGLFLSVVIGVIFIIAISQGVFTGAQFGPNPVEELIIGTCNPAEDLYRPCEKQQGVCMGAQDACLSTGDWNGCTDLTYSANAVNNKLGTYEKTESLCDGVDNDCNGVVDEDITPRPAQYPFEDVGIQSSYLMSHQNGLCKGNTEICENGQWLPNPDNHLPAPEICNWNHLDEDCDGIVDRLYRDSTPTNPIPSQFNIDNTCSRDLACGNNVCEGTDSSGTAYTTFRFSPETCRSCSADCGACATEQDIEPVYPAPGSTIEINEGQLSIQLELKTALDTWCQYKDPQTGNTVNFGSAGDLKTSHSTTYYFASGYPEGIYDITHTCYTLGTKNVYKQRHVFSVTVKAEEPAPVPIEQTLIETEPVRELVEPIAAPLLTQETLETSAELLELEALLAQLEAESEESTQELVDRGEEEVSEPFCGDGSCKGGENCQTCSADCGQCPEVTGAPEPKEDSFGGAITSAVLGTAVWAAIIYFIWRFFKKRRNPLKKKHRS